MKTMKRTKIASLVAGALLALGASSAQAALSSVGPFTGDLTETWESFANFPPALANPTDIMGGAASIANPSMAIYQPGVLDFNLFANGFAQVADGVKAMGLNGDQQTAIITFDNSQTSFGAFWGASRDDSGSPGVVRVAFLDASNQIIDMRSFDYLRSNGDGVLEWHGWKSDLAFKSVIFAGNSVVSDGLQASGPDNGTTNPAPEPGSLALAGLGLVTLVGALRRRSK